MKINATAAAVIVGLCAVQAQANTRVASTVYGSLPGSSINEGNTLVGNPGLPPDATVTTQVDRNYNAGIETGTNSGYAAAGFGWLRADTGVNLAWTQDIAQTSSIVYATAGFHDSLVFDNGTPGSTGIATLRFLLNGSLNESLGLGSNVNLESTITVNLGQQGGVLLDSNNTTTNRFWIWISGTSPTDLNQMLSFRLQYTSGVPIELGTTLTCTSGRYLSQSTSLIGSASTSCGSSNSLQWRGLQSATNINGNPLGVTIASTSGVNYAASIMAPALAGGVPEPASWALLISGFGLVGVAARRRRARLA